MRPRLIPILSLSLERQSTTGRTRANTAPELRIGRLLPTFHMVAKPGSTGGRRRARKVDTHRNTSDLRRYPQIRRLGPWGEKETSCEWNITHADLIRAVFHDESVDSG